MKWFTVLNDERLLGLIFYRTTSLAKNLFAQGFDFKENEIWNGYYFFEGVWAFHNHSMILSKY